MVGSLVARSVVRSFGHLVSSLAVADCSKLEPDPQSPPTSGFRFYRAEPRPAHWGDTAWPDSWDGGDRRLFPLQIIRAP